MMPGRWPSSKKCSPNNLVCRLLPKAILPQTRSQASKKSVFLLTFSQNLSSRYIDVGPEGRGERSVDSAADNLLMLKVRDGDVGKFSFLFERHHRVLFNFFLRLTGNRDLSEDLVQEVFLRMLKYRHTFRPDSQFSAWMYHVARNAQVDHFRKHKHEGVLDQGQNDEEGSVAEPVSADLTPEENFKKQQEACLVRRALARLSADKQEVLILSRYQGLKYEEIATILGCDVGTVKGRVFRAMRDLTEIFFRLSKQGSKNASAAG
jgi:RNA polymerase sigma factor (sigma-70 family)